jgi:diguanylate cyclase (GGDEF)-like protein/PAS domain S-box-containing protein
VIRKQEFQILAQHAAEHLFELSPDAILLTDAEGVIHSANPGSTALFGYTAAELHGKSVDDLVPQRFRGSHSRHRKNYTAHPRTRSMDSGLNLFGLRKNGTEFPADIVLKPVVTATGSLVICIVRDVTEQRDARKMVEMAFHDPLTGLANRHLLMDRLTRAVAATARRKGKLGLMFIDLDNFKSVNDTFGHLTGDRLLQEVARRITGCIRETDSLGRFGGDEFVAMVEDLSDNWETAASQARVIADKILAAVALPCVLEGNHCSIVCSIGITLVGDNRKEAEEVLQQADFAMYQAKAMGRNTVSFFAPGFRFPAEIPDRGRPVNHPANPLIE